MLAQGAPARHVPSSHEELLGRLFSEQRGNQVPTLEIQPSLCPRSTATAREMPQAADVRPSPLVTHPPAPLCGRTSAFQSCFAGTGASVTLDGEMQCCTWIGLLVANSLDRQIRQAVYVLSQGGVVAVPTDTVYGLAADARNASAVAKVLDLKGRSPDAPLPLLVADLAQAETLAGPFSGAARALAEHFWPGALTLVVPAKVDLPEGVTRDGAVGLRVPDDPICLRVIELFGGPVTGTSANLTGRAPAMTPDEVRKQLGRKVDYVVEAGRAGGARPSTVARVSATELSVVRQGAISDEDLRATWNAYRASLR